MLSIKISLQLIILITKRLRGDVFQIVPSKRFSQQFKGDEFNVYRALRSVNPSPYLFYFDYGDFKIFGSSPEAQLIVSDGKAEIHPIAGTQVVADTFPAGTLSGAPKHMAMQLLEKYENRNRTFYGGAIGFMDFNGNFNHAIIIRSFLSKNHSLHYQAGAGIVSGSDPEKELQEVYNKLGALTKALQLAEEI